MSKEEMNRVIAEIEFSTKTSLADRYTVEEFMDYAGGYLSEKITWNDVMPIVWKIMNTPETVSTYKSKYFIKRAIESCRIDYVFNECVIFITHHQTLK